MSGSRGGRAAAGDHSKRGRLLVLGSGLRIFREYALRAMAAHADLVLISAAEPTWERAYCTGWVLADLGDARSILAAIRDLGADGLVTYDERYVEVAARVAGQHGFAAPSPAAVRPVKDKAELRARMAFVAPVRFAVAYTLSEAYAALEITGLPAVFKPRALGGSAGVRMVTSADDVPAAFADATTARIGTTSSRYAGVLIEEYVDGPEFSIDSVTAHGMTTPVLVAEKHTGLAPYFEETGHVVPEAPGSLPPGALDLVCQAHAVAGLDNVVSHAEVRVSRRGPRLIELNARLGGDLIPYLGMLASQVDLPGAAAQIALGQPPTICPERLIPRSSATLFAWRSTRMSTPGRPMKPNSAPSTGWSGPPCRSARLVIRRSPVTCSTPSVAS